MLYTFPWYALHASFIFPVSLSLRPFINFSMEGVTRTSELTPDRLELLRCRFAQSRGEWPGVSWTLLRAFGVLITLGLPEGGRARDPFEVGGPLFGAGPRLGTGPRTGLRPGAAGPRGGMRPVAVALRPWAADAVGNGRKLDTETLGGGAMSDGEEESLDGGAMLPFAAGATT
jgi:hypothetical protein